MPHAHYNAICEMVRRITDVRKTYLPQCLARKVTEAPVQEVALVLEMAAYQQSVLVVVGEGLARVQPLGTHLDAWPMGDGDILLPTIRVTRPHIRCLPKSY